MYDAFRYFGRYDQISNKLEALLTSKTDKTTENSVQLFIDHWIALNDKSKEWLLIAKLYTGLHLNIDVAPNKKSFCLY